MTNNIKTYQLFVRDRKRSADVADTVRDLFSRLPSPITESNNGDLVVAIGGDGTFIDAVTTAEFNKDKIFAGVNTGTLGFLQNISPEEFYSFIKFFSDKKEILTRKLYLPTITVFLENGNKFSFFAVNEVVFWGTHANPIKLTEYVNGDLYQKISASSVCVACSTGDTAFSLGAGGSIDFSDHFQLVRTFSIAITNAAYENYISNPVVCPFFYFEIDRCSKFEILIDGRHKNFDSFVSAVNVSIYGAHYIHKLELGTYSKVNTVRSKILGCDV